MVSEADFIRQLANEEVIQLGHIERALKAKQTRTGRVSARILDDMLAGIILIDTAGAAVGKCNGLTVLEVGDSVFGVPARISATVYPGSSGIVDIEREVNLGQPIHSKGVMILTGYLGSRYAQEFPLEISASIALEQSYGYVDGDSASLGEVCTLISALSRTPLKAVLRHYRLDQPVRRGSGGRRRQREDRGLLPPLRSARSDRRTGCDHPARQTSLP
ncbi:putative ATP-dependent protease [Pseudomonas aeruginosa]|nr:putative ATP-dependent protease [Pseudomonas aeruginosa]